MGLFESITHKEEIESLVNDAKQIYDSATQRLEEQKQRTSRSLKKLGKQKLRAWSGEMCDFIDAFNMFNNIEMVYKISKEYNFAGKNEQPKEIMVNMERASLTAKSALGIGALSVGTGALVGVAAYGGAMMFAHASTGTAIKALSGAAKTNATLAWFGGGSLKAGGLGKMGGKLVLSGIVVAPMLLVAGLITAAKSKERLAEAQKMHAEAENAVAQMNVVISGMEGIERMSENYQVFLSQMKKLFTPFIKEMKRIAKDYTPGADGKINFDQLSDVEQKTLHVSWLLAQLYYHSLSATILTDDGNVADEAEDVLDNAKHELAMLSSDVAQLDREKSEIKQLLVSSKKAFESSKRTYLQQKKKVKSVLLDYGKQKMVLCTGSLLAYVKAMSVFEDIEIANTLHFTPFGEDAGDVFPVLERVTTAAETLLCKGFDSIDPNSLLEIASFGGFSYLEEASQQDDPILYSIQSDKHDLALWLGDTLDAYASTQVVFAGVSMAQIENATEMLQRITGKESLEQARSIRKNIDDLTARISNVKNEVSKISDLTSQTIRCYKSLSRILHPFMDEIQAITTRYAHETVNTIAFDCLTASEQKVLETAWNFTKLQYYILSAPLFVEEYAPCLTLEESLCEAKKEIKLLTKSAYKASDDYLPAANLLWKTHAHKAMYFNYTAMVAFIALSVLQLIHGNWFGLSGIAGLIIALPHFFYFKQLPQSKLFFWRVVRFIAAIVVVVIIQILGMVR